MFMEKPGRGATGTVDGHRVTVGRTDVRRPPVLGAGGGQPGPAVLVRVLSGRHLQLRAVAQHDLRETGGEAGGHHRAPETLADETREVAAVVQVCVSDHDGLDVPASQGRPRQVASAQASQALEEAAVDQDTRMAALDQELAAGARAHKSRPRLS